MQYKIIFIISLILLSATHLRAQADTENDSTQVPTINYSNINPKYEIAGITISGAENYEDFIIVGYSGLAIGDIISVPGNEITNAVKRFWKQGLFSDVKIAATKIKGNKIWLNIALKERPRVSEVNYTGLKKSEIEDLENQIGIIKGNQITPNLSDRAELVIGNFMREKGFLNADVKVYQRNDPAKAGFVIIDIDVNKKLKTKINEIYISLNVVL